MTRGPEIGKTIRFKVPDAYDEWAEIIDSDTRDGEAGWIVELEEYDEDDNVIATHQHFVKDSDIVHVVEFESDGDKEFVIWGKVGMPTVTHTEHENGVSIMEVDFESNSEKLGEICICAGPEGLRDIANFLNEQANIMEGIAPEDRVGGFGHVHYRGCADIWPDIIVMPPQDEQAESESE